MVGAEGSATSIKNRLRTNGPNFNFRKENVEQVLYAIRNGGFSGAIMPENIVLGDDAQAVASFLAQYSGREAQEGAVREHHALHEIGLPRGRRRRVLDSSASGEDPEGVRAALGAREPSLAAVVDAVLALDRALARGHCPAEGLRAEQKRARRRASGPRGAR